MRRRNEVFEPVQDLPLYSLLPTQWVTTALCCCFKLTIDTIRRRGPYCELNVKWFHWKCKLKWKLHWPAEIMAWDNAENFLTLMQPQYPLPFKTKRKHRRSWIRRLCRCNRTRESGGGRLSELKIISMKLKVCWVCWDPSGPNLFCYRIDIKNIELREVYLCIIA